MFAVIVAAFMMWMLLPAAIPQHIWGFIFWVATLCAGAMLGLAVRFR